VGRSILELKNVSKYFPGIKALDGVDFKIRTGEVHALIGENGAGKSTLVKILTGIHQPRTGSIILDGKEVEFKTPLISQAAGIAAIHQEATMFPELTVTENIYMGHHLRKSPFGILDWRQMKKRTKGLLENLELDIQADTLVKNLSVAQRHMVEIVKALSMDARIVIMDEPTSSLSLKEIEHLYKIIRRLKAEERAIVFISHKFEDIYEIADYFTVFRDGKKSGQGVVAETELDDIVNMMVGRSIEQMLAYRYFQGCFFYTAPWRDSRFFWPGGRRQIRGYADNFWY
jgi:rhamnose transport system ATP-binding protein